jgi:hypothetical protein
VSDARKLTFEFIEVYLGVEHVVGVQNGFGIRPDMILFNTPNGSTLAVDYNVLLKDRETARAEVAAKLEASRIAFERREHGSMVHARRPV